MTVSNRKLVIALEGGDGTGKSTLAAYAQELCSIHSLNCTIVGRLEANADAAVAQLSNVLRWSGSQAEPTRLRGWADVLVRLAREHQRLRVAESAPGEVVLFDRFTVSVASRALSEGIYGAEVINLLRTVSALATLRATVFCECPFETAWGRVQARAAVGAALSPKEQLGEQFNRRLSTSLAEAFRTGDYTGEKWSVNTAVSVDRSKAQLASFLEPALASFIAQRQTRA